MNMKSALHGIIGMAMGIQIEMDYMKEARKAIIIKRWEETKKMPRKMKKRVRKELRLDWAIANWDPFEGLGF